MTDRQLDDGVETNPTENQLTRRDYVRSSLGINIPSVTGMDTVSAGPGPDIKNACFRLLANGNIKFLLEFNTKVIEIENQIRPDELFDISGTVRIDNSIKLGWYSPYTISKDGMWSQLEKDGLTKKE